MSLNSPSGSSLTWIAAICTQQPPIGSASQLIYTVEETTNQQTFIHFLAKLQRHMEQFDDEQQFVFVMDNHAAHQGALFEAWISQFDGRVILHQIPPSSSPLNNVEHLWSSAKSRFTQMNMADNETGSARNITNVAQLTAKLRSQMVSVMEQITRENEMVDCDMIDNIAQGGGNERYSCVVDNVTL